MNSALDWMYKSCLHLQLFNLLVRLDELALTEASAQLTACAG